MIANRVVLPAPFGPTSATIWPSSAKNEAWSSASNPPKRREMFCTRSSSATGRSVFGAKRARKAEKIPAMPRGANATTSTSTQP